LSSSNKREKRATGNFHQRWVKLYDDVIITPGTVIEKSRHRLSLSSEVSSNILVWQLPTSQPLRAILPSPKTVIGRHFLVKVIFRVLQLILHRKIYLDKLIVF
jgi:alpha-D-ribose 1-methylphosphonate 5-phosphate C-P lyase